MHRGPTLPPSPQLPPQPAGRPGRQRQEHQQRVDGQQDQGQQLVIDAAPAPRLREGDQPGAVVTGSHRADAASEDALHAHQVGAYHVLFSTLVSFNYIILETFWNRMWRSTSFPGLHGISEFSSQEPLRMQEHETHLGGSLFRRGLHTSWVMVAWNRPPPVVLAAGAQREVVSELWNQQFQWHEHRHTACESPALRGGGGSCHSPAQRKRTSDFLK
ncbi:uncharacterized protein LOC114221175 [Eumetopias jubatus]|uniref:uncharacterized protein LOC114221175 n=1 Tax=Eumetopias jubatus TaxID=34886 RepID=UPI0010160960|nr:uncharacterized protein LOC114221175 [Eumetopias jubatus]